MSQDTDKVQPHILPRPCGTTPSHEDQQEEQVLKFFIGLRLLGEKKQKRFLEYMATIQEQHEGKGDLPHDI